MRLRRLLPGATALAAVFLDLLPMPVVFLVGAVYDALAGLPLGLTSLVLLPVRALMGAHQRFFGPRSFLVIWSCFLVLAPLAEGLRWLVSCLWWGWPFAPEPILVELGLSLALFPVVAWLLGTVHALIPRPGP